MANELQIFEPDALTPAERTDLDKQLDGMIASCQNNRREINQLVFECVNAMTAADDAQETLSSKGFFSRLWGGISGSNQRLQNKINENRAAAQYASQRTLQKIAEQNLMTFDLITAVNNKLDASMNNVNAEFNNIYKGLGKFFNHYRSTLVKISNGLNDMDARISRLEKRMDATDNNVALLNWENSIEYLEFKDTEYADLDDAEKIVCLARDFYDITKGNWSTSDLLLLKKAMKFVDLEPREEVNYFGTLKEIVDDKDLQQKLIGSLSLDQPIDPSYLISAGTLQKLNLLEDKESYIVDTVNDYLPEVKDSKIIRDDLVRNYIQKMAAVNVNTEIESYDLILDLLYNLSTISQSLEGAETTIKLEKARKLWEDKNYDEAIPAFKDLAEQENADAQWLLGLAYETGEGVIQNYEKALELYKKAAEQGNADGQNHLGNMYKNGYGIPQDYSKAIEWYRKAEEQENPDAQCNLGVMYENGYGVSQDYEKAVELYKKAAEQGYARGQCNLGAMYVNGNGITQDYAKALELFKKSAAQNYGNAQNWMGWMYENGKGVPQDSAKAVEWYRKALDL